MKKSIVFAGIFVVLFSLNACHVDDTSVKFSGKITLTDGTTFNCPGGVHTNSGRMIRCYTNSDFRNHNTIDVPLKNVSDWSNKVVK